MTPPENETNDYNVNTDPRDDDDALVATMPLNLAGSRFDLALAQVFPQYSRARLQQWIKSGRVWLKNELATPKTKVWGGEAILVLPETAPEHNAFRPEPVDFPVVYEDDTILVINKPAGLVVHPGHGNWSGTLLNGLLHRYPALVNVPRAGIVHRLDKDTSGLMVVARTLIAQTDLVRQLQARTVSRLYWAVVTGNLTRTDYVDGPMGRHPGDRLKMAVHPTGKPALTHYTPKQALLKSTLVECKLSTGRTHQIRVHMQYIGHPLLGDPVYAPPIVAAKFTRQALHAHRLGLVHPQTGKTVYWESPMPEDMATLIESLALPDDYDEAFDD